MYRADFNIFIMVLILISSSDANNLKYKKIENQTDIADVVQQIVFSPHLHEFNSINIVNSMFSTEFFKVEDLIRQIMSQIGAKINVRVLNFNENFLSRVRNRMFFNILLLDSIEAFRTTARNITSKRFNFRGYYLIIFEAATNAELSEMFQTFWDMYISNINVLTRESENSITISTFVPFRKEVCNSTEPQKLTKFTNGSFTNKPEHFFPDKFKNFHLCPIKVTTFESLAPSVLKEDFANGSYRLYGRDVDVFQTLAEELNFKADVFYILKYGGWGILFPNGSATASMGRAIRREADIILGNLYLKYDRAQVMEYSFVYYLDTLVFVIPDGKLLTSFQKLLRPFTFSVWIYLLVTILLGFIVIAFLQFRSKLVRDFVIGRNVKSAGLNLLGVVFGLGQHLLPRANFSRSLLMMFILFCLVLR